MITIAAHNKTLHIPDKWEELTPRQYTAVVAALLQFEDGKLSLFDLKLQALRIVSGYKRSRKRFSPEQQERITDNLVLLAEQVHFMLKPYYPDKEIMDVFSDDLRRELETRFPFEIYEPKFRAQLDMVGDRLKPQIRLQLGMKTNPLPFVRLRLRKYSGIIWQIDENNLLTTTLRAEQYIDALEYYKLYYLNKKEIYLNSLVAVLYMPVQGSYTQSDVLLYAGRFARLSKEVKTGVFFFFQGIQEYFLHDSPYSFLFAGSEPQDNDKINMGMIRNLYSLAKEGYGSKEELARMNVIDFMNLLVKQLSDAVESLRSLGKKDFEIARTLDINIEILDKL